MDSTTLGVGELAVSTPVEDVGYAAISGSTIKSVSMSDEIRLCALLKVRNSTTYAGRLQLLLEDASKRNS